MAENNSDKNIWVAGPKKKDDEPMTRTQKIFMISVFSAMALAILLVVLLNINFGGDKARIAKQYDSLTKDNVFKTTTIASLEKLASENGDFYVMVASPTLPKAEQFVYEVNAVAKEEGIEVIYYLDYSACTTSDLRAFRALIDADDVTYPTVVKFVATEAGEKSHCCYRTDTHDLALYQGNLRNLIRELYAFDENA